MRIIYDPKGSADQVRINDIQKREAKAFLIELQQELNDQLPDAATLRQEIPRIIASRPGDPSKVHLGTPEYVFINHFAIPIIFDAMQSIEGIEENEARKSLLCEFYRHMPKYCITTAARAVPSPFLKKNLNAKTSEIMKTWLAGKVEKACPDLAFTEPFPHRVVFEGKYFKGSTQDAANELVANIQQAFFYRSFPYVATGPNGRPEWNYDFSCLLACDASDDGSLLAAWNAIPEKVRAAFWDGANLYVMIVRS
jgi:hypothetical protein